MWKSKSKSSNRNIFSKTIISKFWFFHEYSFRQYSCENTIQRAQINFNRKTQQFFDKNSIDVFTKIVLEAYLKSMNSEIDFIKKYIYQSKTHHSQWNIYNKKYKIWNQKYESSKLANSMEKSSNRCCKFASNSDLIVFIQLMDKKMKFRFFKLSFLSCYKLN